MENPTHDNLLPYLREVDTTFRNGFENEELRKIFLNNTFEELKGLEVTMSMIKSASFIVENLLTYCDFKVVAQFLTALSESWEKVVSNQSGCHVLQSVLRRVSQVIMQDVNIESYLLKILLKSTKNLAENLICNEKVESWMQNVYATHAIRSLVEVLGCVSLPSNKQSNKKIILEKDKMPKGFNSKLKSYCKSLENLKPETLVLMFTDNHASPCLSHTIQILTIRLPKSTKRLCSAILQSGGSNNQMAIILCKDKIGSRLVESIIEVNGMWDIIYATIEESNRMNELLFHPTANFVIQKLLSSVRVEEKFMKLFDIVSTNMNEIFADRKYGLIDVTAKQCLNFPNCQSVFLNKLLETLGCVEMEKRKYVIPLVASLLKYDKFVQEKFISGNDISNFKTEYHGSILLQTLIKFDNIGLMLRSISEIPPSFIEKLVCDACGSHFVDEIIKSDKVKIKKKRQILNRFENYICEMAMNKYGSRVIDNMWRVSDIEMKIIISKQLTEKKSELTQDQFGKHLIKSCGINQFVERKNQWMNFQRQIESKRKIFADVIPTTSVKKRKVAMP